MGRAPVPGWRARIARSRPAGTPATIGSPRELVRRGVRVWGVCFVFGTGARTHARPAETHFQPGA